MTTRYTVSLDAGSTWTQVKPVNGASLSLEDSRDLDKGQVFFRRHLKGSPKLKGADYLLLYPLERAPHRRCEEVLLRLETKCGTAWREAWRGRFSAGSCTWDLDRCEVELKVETVDRYTCLFDGIRVKRNILQAPAVNANARIITALEVLSVYIQPEDIGLNLISFTPAPGLGLTGGIYPSASIPTPTNWWLGTFFQPGLVTIAGFPVDELRTYWRERINTECVGGTPAAPPGAGWVMIEDNCATDGTAVWVRQPTFSWPFGDPVQGTCVDGVAIEPATPCDIGWTNVFPCGLFAYDEAPGPDPIDPSFPLPPFFSCLVQDAGTDINRSRLMEDVAEYLIEQTGCGLEGVRSDFFEWLPPGDAPGYVPGQNYVTGTPNQHASLLIAQKSDVITPAASNPATIGEMSMEDFLMILNVTHQILWRIDDSGYIRLEHWSYWAAQQGLDLTTEAHVVERLRYEHLSEAIPRIERAQWMEQQSRDFVGKDIVYSGPCVRVVDDEGIEEYSPGRITTDITFILNDPTAISKDGFVIMASTFDGSVYNVIIDNGAITGNLITNAPMSWANLMRDFWTYNRFLPSAEMNGQPTVFDGYRPNIEQKDVSVPTCCALYALDPSDYLTTALGQRVGVEQAIVQTAEHDLVTGRSTFVLRYAY